MSASRNELQHLIDELTDDQVPDVVADLRRRTKPRLAPAENAFAWVGAGAANNGRDDNAERVDDLLAEGFGSNQP